MQYRPSYPAGQNPPLTSCCTTAVQLLYNCCTTAVISSLQVKVLREMRPGSIETPQQQRFIGEYSKRLWKEHARAEQKQQLQQPQIQQRQQAVTASPLQSPLSPAVIPPGLADTAGATSEDSLADSDDLQLPDGYPRTPHLPFSPEVSSDDLKLDDSACSDLLGHEVMILMML